MRHFKSFLFAITVTTLSNASFGPTPGWWNGAPRLPMTEEAVCTTSAVNVTSMAIDQSGKPWITTSDGRLLRLQHPGNQPEQWQDVSAMFSNYFNNPRAISYKFNIQIPPKFKYVTSAPGSGSIWAIDEEGYIYRWN